MDPNDPDHAHCSPKNSMRADEREPRSMRHARCCTRIARPLAKEIGSRETKRFQYLFIDDFRFVVRRRLHAARGGLEEWRQDHGRRGHYGDPRSRGYGGSVDERGHGRDHGYGYGYGHGHGHEYGGWGRG